ncbi:hypothetical protein BDV23DRAFT_144228, partial [Aspergillus alliaceus]
MLDIGLVGPFLFFPYIRASFACLIRGIFVRFLSLFLGSDCAYSWSAKVTAGQLSYCVL